MLVGNINVKVSYILKKICLYIIFFLLFSVMFPFTEIELTGDTISTLFPKNSIPAIFLLVTVYCQIVQTHLVFFRLDKA